MTPCEARSVASTRGDCSVFGAHKMHAMRGRPEIAGRHGAGHAEAVHRPCGFMRGTGRPWPSARRSHPSGRRGTPFGFALAEVLNSLYKAELIRNRPRLDEHGPREGIDAARARHRPVGPLVQHGAPPLRHRHAHPGRARGRPGPRHRPPGTTTTDHHRNQLTEPPQNPGLDTQDDPDPAGICHHTRRHDPRAAGRLTLRGVASPAIGSVWASGRRNWVCRSVGGCRRARGPGAGCGPARRFRASAPRGRDRARSP